MEGGSQAQDHGQAIYAKIRYSVSSTFATGCSTVYSKASLVLSSFHKRRTRQIMASGVVAMDILLVTIM